MRWLRRWVRRRPADSAVDVVRDFFARRQPVGLILPDGRSYDDGATLHAVTGDFRGLTIELDTGRSVVVTGDATIREVGGRLVIRDFDVATFGREGGGVHTVREGAIEIGSAGPARMTRTLTVADVRAAVAASDRPGRHVRIGDDDGRLPGDDTSVLLHRPDDTWFTAYAERGTYYDLRVFEDEDAACRDFLEMIGQLSAAVVRAFFGRWSSVYVLMPDGWLGRPYDSWYELESVTDDRIELTIAFAGGLSLTVPHAATVRDVGESLLITDFDSAMLRGGGFGTRRYRPGVIELMAVSPGVLPVGHHGPR
ncbi:hypothetical protein [Aeromicrobium fastidiosum]|uniref:Uncharacterized protein n=1 Tax=Aeromicrobium fastidiosum TaxID=52699 RepID=A0A641AGT8_9ACTN|nr:hypothetical protein [Aeromicrobium fastidiosum]KAA1372483.1 hypothetical protein ESP62_018965 [Aeromicrobium fastidiosum]MBP2391437.1 hypothetical protein [Aeromicrobium fastidiosum]